MHRTAPSDTFISTGSHHSAQLMMVWCARVASKHPLGSNRASAGMNGAVEALLCRAPALRQLTLDFGAHIELELTPPGVPVVLNRACQQSLYLSDVM